MLKYIYKVQNSNDFSGKLLQDYENKFENNEGKKNPIILKLPNDDTPMFKKTTKKNKIYFKLNKDLELVGDFKDVDDKKIERYKEIYKNYLRLGG